MNLLGIDIGRTKIAAAVVSNEGHILEARRAPSPKADMERIADVVVNLSRILLAQHRDVTGVGVGTAEVVEWPNGIVLVDGGLGTFPLREHLQSAIGLPVIVDSDANAAAWGEYRFGAAQAQRDVVMLTVGTGIGGGIVLDGKIHRGAHGFAGEVGHLIVQPSGERCACGSVGCWETVASGSALGRQGRQVASTDPGGYLAKLAGHPEKVTGFTVFDAATCGDPVAVKLFERAGGWLGVGIAMLVLVLDPEIVVIGGGVSAAGDLLLAPARTSARRGTLVRDGWMPPVVEGIYGSDAGMVGAAILALDVDSGLVLGG